MTHKTPRGTFALFVALTLFAGALATPGQAEARKHDLSSMELFNRVVLLIKENYLEPARFKPRKMFEESLEYVERTVPEVMTAWNEAGDEVTIHVADKTERFRVREVPSLFQVAFNLRRIFAFIEENYQAKEEDVARVEYAAINGMLSTLDPHSNLLPPRVYREMRVGTRGEFGGLGIVISIRDGQLTVISPLEDTPAFAAGIKAKDRITRINEESTVGMTLEEAVTRLRGKKGTPVSIWVKRPSWPEPRRFDIVRDTIVIRSVESEMLPGDVGYVKIKNFQENTSRDLHAHLSELKDKSSQPGRLKGLVLDLRNNPGGLLDQAIRVGNTFLDSGVVVATVGQGERRRDDKRATRAGTEPDYPIVVLVNNGSASASEIVAGALKHHRRAVIVGQQTFGKGSVQVLYDFHDGSALKLTIAQWLAGGELSIQSVGIAPDVMTIPVLLHKDEVALNVAEEIMREEDLDQHLVFDDKPPAEKPKFKLKYLHQVEEPDPKADPAREEKKDPQKDFEVRFGAEVLRNSAQSERGAMLREVAQQVDNFHKSEQEKVAARLKELGVDWTAGPNSGPPPALEAKLEILEEATPPLTSGDKGEMKVSVTNTGQGAAFQVSVVTRAEMNFFDKREFLIGRLEPGKSKHWSLPFKIPESAWEQSEPIRITVLEQHDRVPAEQNHDTHIKALPSPRFGYNAHIEDPSPEGNGDGLIQRGETFDLVVRMRNLGEGASVEAVAALKNESGKGLFIKDGREPLGVVAPNDESVVRFRLWAKENITANEVKVKLSIADTGLLRSFNELIRFPVTLATPTPVKAQTGLLELTADSPVHGGAANDTPVIAKLPQGSKVEVVGSMPGWFKVRLGEKKKIKQGKESVERDMRVHGFVQADRAVQTRGKKSAAQVTHHLGVRPPQLETRLEPAVGITDLPSLKLHAKARDDRRIRDVYIFVNNSKVFYRPGQDAPAASDAGVELSFTTELPLEEGTNAVSVIVREDDELLTRRSFSVFRRSTDAKDGRASVVDPASNKSAE